MPQSLAPSAPSVPASRPGTESSRSFFAPAQAPRPLALWGSSSLRSEGGGDGAPLKILIHEHLAVANAPAVIHEHAVSAIRSEHSLLMRGLLELEAVVDAADRGRPGPATITFRIGFNPAGRLRIPGTLGDIPGLLANRKGSWLFTPDDESVTVADGVFRSSLGDATKDARHILWMGKNNIRDEQAVLDHTHMMWEAAAEGDTLVMGHWATVHDAKGSRSGDAVRRVNEEMARRYGRQYVDVQAELTVPQKLAACAAIAPLRILEQASTQEALDQEIVPPALISRDDIHLNGWGNLAVCAALVRRMRELRWL